MTLAGSYLVWRFVTPSDTRIARVLAQRKADALESIVVAIITGIVTLVGVILSNSKSRAVMEVKIDNLAAKVEKHNSMIERTYALEQAVAVAQNDIETLKGKVG